MIPSDLVCQVLAPNREIAAAVARLLPEVRTELGTCPAGAPPSLVGSRDAMVGIFPEVARRLGWMELRTSMRPGLPAQQVLLTFSLPAEDCQSALQICTDSYARAMELAEILAPFFEEPVTFGVLGPQEEPLVRAINQTRRVGLIAALVAGEGGAVLPVREQMEEGFGRVVLQVRGESRGLADCPIRIRTDDPAAGAILASRLQSAGSVDVRVDGLPPDGAVDAFRLHLGVLGARPTDGRAALVGGLVEDFLDEWGVDRSRWALEVGARPGDQSVGALIPEIILPVVLHELGGLCPNRGTGPDRFPVEVACEDFDEGRRIAERLEEQGFRGVTVTTPAPTEIDRAIAMDALSREPALLARVRAVVAGPYGPVMLKVDSAMGRRVRVVIPPVLTELERLARLQPRRASCRVCLVGTSQRRLTKALEEIGFSDLMEMGEYSREKVNRILHSGVDMADVEEVADTIRRLGGPTMRIEPNPRETDPEIHVHLVWSLDEDRAPVVVRSRPFLGWERPPWPSVQPFVELGEQTLRVGGLVLPRRGPPRPLPASLAHYVLDCTTAHTLLHVAQSVLRREVVLLEGPTSTSKTSVILYLAALLGQPVVRINLSAQSETAELLGRYVPQSSVQGAPGWRWVDGRLVSALRQGVWVILDELNLAEPSMLERLNPLLEEEPSLLLAEREGERFGAEGTPIHPNFRVFATMNPATYAGRSVLSPALRDRFLGFRAVTAPTEDDVLAMLEQLVLGEARPLTVQGITWAPVAVEARLPWVGGPPAQLPALLRQLARLQVQLMALGDAGDLPRSGREPPVFTRRGLLALLRAVAADTAAGHSLDDALREALLRYVVARAVGEADRAALARILDTVFLGPNAWVPGLVIDGGRPGASDRDGDEEDCA